MSNFSNFLQNANLNWLKGISFPSAPAAPYLALFNGDPTDAGTGGAEVTTTIRTAGRIPVTFGAISNNASMSNSVAADFGNAVAGATFTHFAIFDAATGGNLLHSAPLTGQPITVSTGTDVSFPVGSLGISID